MNAQGKSGNVSVPGFYKDVATVSATEAAMHKVHELLCGCGMYAADSHLRYHV